ncbi:Anoctamin-4 [Folsomia candida]|uniref:Anoctamin n=1 Tax=Folsomia candida TaxID=158441 RepID=A0A226E438_FOLCA|nr:Anoctamin-4 [Folsomia candida]
MHVKKSEVDSVSNQLQDADDLESSVGSIALGGDAVNHHGPTPYIVVREFPAWIDRGRSAYTSDNIQPQPHNLQSAQNNQHNILQKSHFNRFSAKDNKGHYHQNGDLVHTISQQFVTEAGPDIVNAENAKQLINQLGLIQYKKPGVEKILEERDENGIAHNAIIFSNSGESEYRKPSSPPSKGNRPPSGHSIKDLETPPDSLYFKDKQRRIDMMLVFEEDLDFLKEQRRKTFLKNLVDEGVEIEIEHPDPTKRRLNHETHFVKVHAPWTVLTKYAEIMNMKMPIKDNKPSGEDFLEEVTCWKQIRSKFKIFDYNHQLIPAEPSFFMASFSRQKEECFIIKDRETFFTPAQRSQIAWKIMTRVRFDDGGDEKVGVQLTGIRRLLNDKTFNASFPLHEGPYNEDNDPNDRRLLFTEWAHFSNWYKKQPLWLIRRYFGDKVALYFAWLGFYTSMLIPASIVGILCFIKEICDEEIGGNIIMCPLCGKCELWQLTDSCTFSKLTYFFDNPATVFFAVFMAFWATSFLEFWKRKHAVISWEWDLRNYEFEEEPRPEFEAAVKTFRINPVTKAPEPYLSFWRKAVRMLIVSSLVFLLLFIVGFVVVGIIIYRLVMMSLLYTDDDEKEDLSDTRREFFQDNAKIITSVSAAIINLVIVVFLHNRVYFKVAIWLTNSEYPRTQTEYEDSFTFKMFLFQFINYYSYLIYIAFFKGRFFRHPGDDSKNSFEKIRGDMCDPAGCLSELFIQLSIIMVGKQFFNNFMEIFMPKFSNWCRRIKYASAVDPDAPVFFTRWEQDFNLKKVDQLALFQEYLEMVIQYGFVTLFVAAFPLAPFFALLNNVVEIRLDAYKWITQMRRPLAERVEDIGAWYGILQGITYTSVVTNAFVIAYTSDIIPRLVYKYTNDHGSLTGYIQSSLSQYPTSNYTLSSQRMVNNVTKEFCYYRGYYTNASDIHPFTPSPRYWHIQTARLAFVAAFEHLAFALTGIMAFAIPDVPKEISVQIQREKLLATEALYESDLAKLRRGEEAQISQHEMTLSTTKNGRRTSIFN